MKASNSSLFLIGKIVKSRFPYFNKITERQEYKIRPLLVIGVECEELPCDLNVLPISTIKDDKKRIKTYDYLLDELKCKMLNLRVSPSFIRINKQSFINSLEVDKNIIADFKQLLPKDYKNIRDIYKDFIKELF